jgi:hypothetical protein
VIRVPTDVIFRSATEPDLPAIVALLADDALGQGRERPELPLHADYLAAFAAIDRDPNQLLAVAALEGRVVGTLQLTFIPGLSHRGARGCRLVQLTTNQARTDAQRFYARLGFAPSHLGFKLSL